MLQNNFINEYDGLIFDMDGTVIDTMPSHAKAWEMVGQHFGYPFDGNLLYEMGGAPVKDIALEITACPWHRLLSSHRQNFIR